MHLVWRSLRLGSSLCHLLNLYLGPDDTPITYDEPDFAFDGRNGVFTWAEQNLKRCQRPAAHFIMRMKELQGQDRWPKSDALWALHELFIDDTGCLVKVLKTVGALLDGLPATAWRHASPATTPHHHQASSSSAAAGAANTASPGVNIIGGGVNVPAPYDRPGSSASTYFPGHPSHLSSGSLSLAREFPIPPTPGRQPLSINTNVVDASGGSRGPPTGGPPPPAQPLPPPELDFGPVSIGRAAMHVWEILKTEKKYVQDLEVLQAYSQEVLHSGILTADSVHLMFSNLTKLVDFQRRFLLSLETEYEPFVEKGGHAWIEGRWGKPFLKHEHDFAVYDPYCANYIQAIDLVEKEAATLSRHNLSLTVPELTSYLVIPVQRLCRYPMLLEALVKSSDKTDYEYKPELAHGYAVAKRIADGVNETLRQHQNLKTVRELAGRVKDWKNHDIADFGALLLDGRFNVTKGDVERDYEVYLFEKMILCCKEIVPEKVKDKRSKSGSILKKQSISGQPAVPPVKNMLSLKGRIYVNNLTHIEHESKNGDYALRVFWRSQENPMEFEHFVLHVKNSEQLAKWESKITSLMRADQSRREQRERERRGRNYVSPASNFPITPANEQGPYGENELRRGSSTSTAWDEEGTPSTTASSHRPIRASERYSSHSIRNSTDDQHVLPSHLRYQQVVGVPPVPMQRLQSTQSLEPTRKAHRGMSDDTYGPSLASSSTDDQQEFLRSVAAEGGRGVNYQSPALRMRSASSPNVYGVGAVDSQPSPASSTVNGGGGVGGWTSQSQTYADYNPSKVSLAAHSDGPHSDFGFKRSSNSSNATDVSEASTPDTPYEGAVLAAALPSLAEHVTTENVIVKVRYYDVSLVRRDGVAKEMR